MMAKTGTLGIRLSDEDRALLTEAVGLAGERAGVPVSMSAWALSRLRAAARQETAAAGPAKVSPAAPKPMRPASELPRPVPLTDAEIAENRRRLLAPTKRGSSE